MKTTVIDLPSQGKFYPAENPLSGGKIEVKYMTAAEEDILTDQTLLKKGIALDKLIESVVVSDINLDDLLLGDKGAVVLGTRILAYGPSYNFEVNCPSCGETNQCSVNLTEIEAKDIDFSGFTSGQNEFDYRLPISEVDIKVKLLTHGDDKNIRTELKKVKRNVGNKVRGQRVGTQITTRLKYFITELDGSRDRGEIRKFVDQMPARDSLELRRFINKINPDIDLKFNFFCDYCAHEEEVDIPLDANFFFPSTEV